MINFNHELSVNNLKKVPDFKRNRDQLRLKSCDFDNTGRNFFFWGEGGLKRFCMETDSSYP